MPRGDYNLASGSVLAKNSSDHVCQAVSPGRLPEAERCGQPGAIQPRIRRPFGRRGPSGGGDRLHRGGRHAMPRGFLENRAGQPVPTCPALAGRVEDAADSGPASRPGGCGAAIAEDGPGEVAAPRLGSRSGRRPRAAGRCACAPSAWSARNSARRRRRPRKCAARSPGGTPASTACSPASLEAPYTPVGQGGSDLDVGRALHPVEHVVGGNVDQRHPGPGAPGGQRRRAIAIGAAGRVGARSRRGRPRCRRRRSPPATAGRRRRVPAATSRAGRNRMRGGRPAAAAPHRPAAASALASWPAAAGDEDRPSRLLMASCLRPDEVSIRNQALAVREPRQLRRPCRTSTASAAATGQGSGEVRIVPAHAALGGRIVVGGDLVDHLGRRLQRAEAVQEAAGYPDLRPVRGAKLGGRRGGRRSASRGGCRPRRPRSAPLTTRTSLPCTLGAIWQCRPRTTPAWADRLWLSCTNGSAMPASAKRLAL